jgi:two-component system response regulator PilR (NtrC family)
MAARRWDGGKRRGEAGVRGVLLIDDEPSMQQLFDIMLRREGYDVLLAGTQAEGLRRFEQAHPSLVITDLKLPDGDGIEILRRVKAIAPDTVVIVMTAYGSTDTAIAALKLGAYDYVVKPFDVDEIRIVVRNALDRQRLEEENLLLKAEFQAEHGLEKIIGRSEVMLAMFKTIRAIAGTSSTVLVTGESGTGKELVAKALHALSPRRDAPFVSINCAALPESLLESELFGYVKGAFTDARQSKKGLFEAAHRGTLFMDEIGGTPLSMQAKLLRALQERRIRRVGGTEEIDVDARIIAATNQPLEALVKQGAFRGDLYYRLDVIPVAVPPLRERTGDVALLAEHFLKVFSQEMGKAVTHIAPEAIEELLSHSWPGNVRELQHVVERAVALEPGPDIKAFRLPDNRSEPATTDLTDFAPGFSLTAHLHRIEGLLVGRALAKAGGDRMVASGILGVTPRALRYLLSKHRETVDS